MTLENAKVPKLIQFLTGRKTRMEVLRDVVKYPEVLREILNRLRAGEADESGALLEMYADLLPSKYAARLREHGADEQRHAALFEAMLIQTGGTPGPVSGETFMTHFRRLSGRSPNDLPAIEELFAGLYQIERRALDGMGLLLEAFDKEHPVRTLLQTVRRDEEKHVRWMEDGLAYLASIDDEHARRVELARRRYAAVDQAAFAAMTGERIKQARAIWGVAATFPIDSRLTYLAENLPRALFGLEGLRRRMTAAAFLLRLRRKYGRRETRSAVGLAG